MPKKNIFKLVANICLIAIMIANINLMTFAEDEVDYVNSIQIVSYKADTYYIGPNRSVNISWEVLNADKVEITGNEDMQGYIVPLKGSLEVWPSETTTFIIKAYGKNGEVVRRNLMINVIKLEIKEFSVSQEEVTPGAIVLLSWNVPEALNVNINELTQKDLPSDGTVEINPYVTTKYTLEATGLDGSFVSREITVRVKEALITDFSADKEEVYCGESVVLSWDTCYFKSIKIVNLENKNLPLFGSEVVKPTGTTTYILEATAYDGTLKSKEITVRIKKVSINNFAADKSIISKGEMVKISWSTQNAQSCSIITNLGNKLINRQQNGMIAVTPNKNTTYQLIAADKMGNEVKKSVDIIIQGN